MIPVVVVSPHPDDETLGCGETLLRHIADGDAVHWLIVTDMRTEYGFPEEVVGRRRAEIQTVAAAYGFAEVHNLGLPPARLDTLPTADLVTAIGDVFEAVSPAVVYLPFWGDVHTDHPAVFDAAVSCTKWFRYPSIRRVLCYETISETDFGLKPAGEQFTPNCYVNISAYVDKKIELAQMYETEMGRFPFPRSPEGLRALARLRGAASGCEAAESFMLLREITK